MLCFVQQVKYAGFGLCSSVMSNLSFTSALRRANLIRRFNFNNNNFASYNSIYQYKKYQFNFNLIQRSISTSLARRQSPQDSYKFNTDLLSEQQSFSSKMVRPAGVLYNWDLRTYSPTQIKDLSYEIIGQAKDVFDQVGRIEKDEDLTFENVLQPILQAYRLFYGYGNANGAIVTLPLKIAVSAELRDASAEATKLFDETSVELAMRKDIFDKLVRYKEKGEVIDPEYQRCLDKLIRTGKKNGLHLSDEIRKEVKDVKTKILSLQLKFGRNLIESKTELLFSAEELAGMPDDFIETLKVDKETGNYIVTLEYPHLYPILKNCRVPSTRRQLQLANYSKCHPENTMVLAELLELRQREATLLGFKNHAEYILDGITMAKDPIAVKNFLEDLASKLQPLWQKEKEVLMDLKAKECEKYGYENSGKLEIWDTGYYANQVEEKFYNLDHEELRKYFSLDAVTKGLLAIYEEILSLKFTHLPDAEKWHDDVMVYQVDEAATRQLVGYFYLDLFPREGKYGHACWVPMQSSCPGPDGVRLPVIGTMLANFTRPTADKPALLTHSEVETYFHEFGHVMHGICSKTKSQLFFGTNVERDFVEAPSQMLENWVWNKEPLKRMSLHYKDKVPLPDDLIEKLASTKKVNAGGFNLRQIVLATFDQKIHLASSHVDTAAAFAETLEAIQGFKAPAGSNFAAGFGHIGQDYSARYYSYLWSEVFCMDMFESKFSKNLFDPEAGKEYREKILAPGGSVDGFDMLRNFLGRDPNSDAFLESKGVALSKGSQ